MKVNTNHDESRVRRRLPRIDGRLIRTAAAVAVAAIGLTFAAPTPVSASSTSAPSDPATTASPGTDGSSGESSGGSSPSYSPPKLQPVALIGAGALVLIAIIWTLRSGSGRSGSTDGRRDSAVSGAPPTQIEPVQSPSAQSRPTPDSAMDDQRQQVPPTPPTDLGSD